MDESILHALMQLFAIVSLIKDEDYNYKSKQVILEYLNKRLNKELTEKYIKLYENYLKLYLEEVQNQKKRRKKLSSFFVKVLKIAEKINETLAQKEKVIVIIRLLEFMADNYKISSDEDDLISTIASTFNIDQKEFNDIKNFILNRFDEIYNTENLLFISPEKKQQNKLRNARHIIDESLDSDIAFLFIKSVETIIFKYEGSQSLRLTARNIQPQTTYVFDSGAIIRGARLQTIYQTQIASYFFGLETQDKVELIAQNIEFFYKNSNVGLHKLTFKAQSGQLIGVLGGSGVGKSTLLNLLIGKYKLQSGKITINGYDIYEDKEKLIPLIGYVPQDDLLNEELTVWQNLYYNAKLCFGNYSDRQISEVVRKTLHELDLWEIRNLKVGNPLKKYISGGQRKRLNIALELIRSPSILYVDEPTSGLSSMDSENVMHQLKRQAINGKLIIVNIHQPSSDIFKMFDEIIVLDRGGYPVYKGNPLDAIIYFKQISNFADSEVAECPTCGTVHPELILEIIEDKVVNEFGKYTEQRKVTPKEWYILYKVNLEKRARIKIPPKKALPQSDFKPPSKFKQYLIFMLRDLKAKVANKQYMLLNLLEAPLLGLILAYISRSPNEEGKYVFLNNHSLVVFLFMAVVVAMFLGLSVSAEEIIKDKKILERERFLNLSKSSYLNSKISILAMLSAYQTLTFLLVSFAILGIKGMLWHYWIILFSISVASNLIGLIISSAFESVVTIYIIIPLILVPQMLLGGAMIHFDDLPGSLRNEKYTPMLTDMMLSRWAYEALAVTQYKDNNYEKHFYVYDKEKSKATFVSMYKIPELERINRIIKEAYQKKDIETLEYFLATMKNELEKIKHSPESAGIKFIDTEKLTVDKYVPSMSDDIKNLLEEIRDTYNAKANKIAEEKETLIHDLQQQHGKEWLINLKKNNANEKLTEVVLNRNRVKQIILYDKELIQKKDPIYLEPDNKFGRAHFFAPVKKIGNLKIDTLYFNTIVFWLYTIFFYLLLYFDVFGKLLRLPENIDFGFFKIKKVIED